MRKAEAYINIYKKVTVTAPGQALGAASSEDVKMENAENASGY